MNEPVFHFAVKSISLSENINRKRTSKPCSLLTAARHNLREIQAELGAVSSIYPERIRDNVIMSGPKTAAEVQAKADALRAGAGIDKLRVDFCQAVEVVFSIPPDSSVDAVGYFEQSLRWLAVAMPYPLLSAVVHNDESTKHLHALLLPLKGGVYVGAAMIDRKNLPTLMESFFNKVAGPAGFRRDGAKLRGRVKEMAVSAVLYECECRGLPELNGPLWEAFKASIERDPTHAMLVLGLSPADLHEHVKMRAQKPIRDASKPIGLAPDHAKRTNLSLGFPQFPGHIQ